MCGVSDEGVVIVEADVDRPGDGGWGQWAVSPDGQWRPVFINQTPVAALPEGVRFADGAFSELFTISGSGVVAGIKRLSGVGATSSRDTAIVTWDAQRGVRMIAREGDPVPREPAGTVYGEFLSIFQSERGDLAFQDATGVYLHHDKVGAACVGRVGEAIANGLATAQAPTRVAMGGTVSPAVRSQVLSGGPTSIDQDGRVYFYAHSAPHHVLYSAQLRIPCPADFNSDGFTDFFDYADFVMCFEDSVCPARRTADFNGDDFVDFFDYADFVTAFETGC